MQENLTSKPFIIALHEDQAHAVRELRDHEMLTVGGGGEPICMIDTLVITPGTGEICGEDAYWTCDD